MRMAWLLLVAVFGLNAHASSHGEIRSAATRALTVIQTTSANFYEIADCFSCHDYGLPMQAYRMARERGISLNEAVIGTVASKGLLTSPNLVSIDDAVQDTTIIDPASDETWGLIAAHAIGVSPNLVTATYARRLVAWQRPDGHWPTFDLRPPHSYSLFTTTASSVRAVQLYLPEQPNDEKERLLMRARRWLSRSTPGETEDFTFRLLGLYWAGGSHEEIGRAARELQGLQRSNGGWAQLPHMEPDAYSTGEALVALNEAGGIPTTDPAWKKGLNYLLSTQAEDGTWHVRTRMVSPAPVSPPFFDSGFPYGHDQVISKAATVWAAMALMLALPKTSKPGVAPPIPSLEPRGIEPWMNTSIFGTGADLKARLDAGLDPNSKTAEGTTLLMMAAHDAGKVKLLIDRGADIRARAKTGYTALIVATNSLGTSESVKLLLAHGAEAQPKHDVQFGASPIMLAATAGDAENVRLLLSAGANPNSKMSYLGFLPTSALTAAAIFDYPDVVQALIARGADVNAKDQDGLTPLHWAVLAHHPGMIGTLKAGGANLNPTDRYGYTPLHYAASVDFGDAETVTALLEAGADPDLKEKEGKTPISLAANYPYIHAALSKFGRKP